MTLMLPGDIDIERIAPFVQNCLAAVVAAAERLGVSLPTRQVAGAGLIPADCEQVVATLIQVNTGAPEGVARAGVSTYPNSESNVTLYTAVVNLQIVRRTVDGYTGSNGTTPPDPGAFLTNLTTVGKDAAVLLSAATALQDGQIVGATPRSITAGNPQGGLLATTLRLSSLV